MTDTWVDPFADIDEETQAGHRAISFKGISERGKWKGGRIVRIGKRQQALEYAPEGQPKNLKFFPNTQDPVYTVPITIEMCDYQTREPTGEGLRTYWHERGNGQYRAVKAAVAKAEAKLRPDGFLFLQWASGEGEAGSRKEWEALVVAAPDRPSQDDDGVAEDTASRTPVDRSPASASAKAESPAPASNGGPVDEDKANAAWARLSATEKANEYAVLEVQYPQHAESGKLKSLLAADLAPHAVRAWAARNG